MMVTVLAGIQSQTPTYYNVEVADNYIIPWSNLCKQSLVTPNQPCSSAPTKVQTGVVESQLTGVGTTFKIE
jgi:hypothetical protein